MLALKLALRSVFRNWRHSAASITSVSLGFLAISAIQGYYEECEKQFVDSYVNRTMTGHIIIDRRSDKPDSSLLDEKALESIRSTLASFGKEVTHVVRFLSVEGIMAARGPSFAFAGLAYDVQEGEKVRGEDWVWNTMYGKPLQTAGKNQVVVGKGLAELLGCKLDDLEPELNHKGSFKAHPAVLECFGPSYQLTALTEKGQMNAADVTISGIVDSGVRELEDSWIMMPLELGQSLTNTQKLSMIGVHLAEADRAEDVRDSLRKNLLAHSPDVTVDKWQDHPLAEIYRSLMGMMVVLQIFMLCVVIIVSALSMMNTVTRSIDERQSEIGTLRSVGYENRFVIRLFAWEGALLGIIGTLLGTAAAYIVSEAVNASHILYHPAVISQKTPFRIAFLPWFSVGLGFALTFGAAITAMAVARLKISKDISAILRHEG